MFGGDLIDRTITDSSIGAIAVKNCPLYFPHFSAIQNFGIDTIYALWGSRRYLYVKLDVVRCGSIEKCFDGRLNGSDHKVQFTFTNDVGGPYHHGITVSVGKTGTLVGDYARLEQVLEQPFHHPFRSRIRLQVAFVLYQFHRPHQPNPTDIGDVGVLPKRTKCFFQISPKCRRSLD